MKCVTVQYTIDVEWCQKVFLSVIFNHNHTNAVGGKYGKTSSGGWQ